MKRILVFWAALLAVGLFSACDNKEDIEPIAGVEHTPLFQTSYAGFYVESGEQEYGGEVYTWSRSYYLHLDFLTDTKVRFHGSIWRSDNSSLKEAHKVEEWSDTMYYAFSADEGHILGAKNSIWDGGKTIIRLGANDSLLIKTKQQGFVSLVRQH